MTYVILVDHKFRITSRPVRTDSKEDLIALETLDVDRCGEQYWRRVAGLDIEDISVLAYFFALAVHGQHENTGGCQIAQLTPSHDIDRSRWTYHVGRLDLAAGVSLSATP